MCIRVGENWKGLSSGYCSCLKLTTVNRGYPRQPAGKKNSHQNGLPSNGVFLRFIKKEYKHIKSRLDSYSGCISYRLDTWFVSRISRFRKQKVLSLQIRSNQGISSRYKTPLGDIAMKISNLILKYLIFWVNPTICIPHKIIQLKHLSSELKLLLVYI